MIQLILFLFLFQCQAQIVGKCGEHCGWMLTPTMKTLIVEGNGTMDDYTDETKQPWREYENTIMEIYIITGISQIGNYSFYGMSHLERIVFPTTLKSIGSSAFQSCTSLEYVGLPSSLEFIGEYAFYHCTHLVNVLVEGLSSPVCDESTFVNTLIKEVYVKEEYNGNDFCHWEVKGNEIEVETYFYELAYGIIGSLSILLILFIIITVILGIYISKQRKRSLFDYEQFID